MLKQIKENKRNYAFIELICIICMVVFYRSQLTDTILINKRRILEYVIIALIILAVPVLTVCNQRINSRINTLFVLLSETKNRIVKNRKKVIFYSIVFILIMPLSIIFGRMISNNDFFPYTIAAVLYVIYFVILFSKKSYDNPERLFVCIALTIGIYSIVVTPSLTGIQMDDEVHYSRSVKLAEFFSNSLYEADAKMVQSFYPVIIDKKGIDKVTRNEIYSEINESYDNKVMVSEGLINAEFNLGTVAYIPSAIGIMVGRGLSLSYIKCFAMGQIFNLLAYVFLFYFAIKKLKSGKTIFMAIGLIPANVFISTTYTYDMWLISFLALGYSYFISIIQSDDKMSNTDMLIMILCFTLGVLPKTVYIVLLFPLLFMPKEKFKNNKQRLLYYALGICIALFICMSFAFPVASGAYEGDSRGGLNIDSHGQLLYILNNPIAYIKTLFTFLRKYLSFSSSQDVLQFFGYIGRGEFYLLTLTTLAVTSFVDRLPNQKHKSVAVRISGLVGAALGVIIVATSLYIIFTPVGLDTINGCQARYILPILVPVLYFIAPEGIGSHAKRNWLTNSVALIMSMTFIYNIYNLSVKLYM